MSILEVAQIMWQELAARIARTDWNLLKHPDSLSNKLPSLFSSRVFLFIRNPLVVAKPIPPRITKYFWCPWLEHGTAVISCSHFVRKRS